MKWPKACTNQKGIYSWKSNYSSGLQVCDFFFFFDWVYSSTSMYLAAEICNLMDLRWQRTDWELREKPASFYFLEERESEKVNTKTYCSKIWLNSWQNSKWSMYGGITRRPNQKEVRNWKDWTEVSSTAYHMRVSWQSKSSQVNWQLEQNLLFRRKPQNPESLQCHS